MKNYLIYSDCYTEEHINQCRYALLKYLSVYNLAPPAGIQVIVYTNKVTAFEIFLSFFKHLLIIEDKGAKQTIKTDLPAISSSYQGNLLVCQSSCYVKKRIDALFTKLGEGGFVLYKTSSNTAKAAASITRIAVQSIGATEPDKKQQQVLPAQDYFVSYEGIKEITKLLKIFFTRNEEESVPNLVKQLHRLDAETIQKEALSASKRSLLQKMIAFITGKNNIVQRYQSKL